MIVIKKVNIVVLIVLNLTLLIPASLRANIIILKYGDPTYMEETPHNNFLLNDSTAIYDPDYDMANKWRLKDSLPDGTYVVTRKKYFLAKKNYHCMSTYANGSRNGKTIWYDIDEIGMLYVSCIATYQNGLLEGTMLLMSSPANDINQLDSLPTLFSTFNYKKGVLNGVAKIYKGDQIIEVHYRKNMPVKWYLYRNPGRILIEEGEGSPFLNPSMGL